MNTAPEPKEEPVTPKVDMKHVECSRCTNCVKCSEYARVTTPCFQWRFAPREMCSECIYF